MSDYKTVAECLRCSSAPVKGKCRKDCPFRLLEEVNPDLPIPADIVIDGKAFWESCDVDKIALDAADAIEQLVRERDSAVKDIPRNCPSCKHSFLNNPDMTGICKYTEICDIHGSKWEWRGVQDE